MALWFTLRMNGLDSLGQVVIQRVQWLDLTDSGAIDDAVSDYKVKVDGRYAGKVQHRYGDGAFVLAHKALGLIIERQQKRAPAGLREDGQVPPPQAGGGDGDHKRS